MYARITRCLDLSDTVVRELIETKCFVHWELSSLCPIYQDLFACNTPVFFTTRMVWMLRTGLETRLISEE